MKNMRARFIVWAILTALAALTLSGRADPPSGSAARQIPEPLKAWEAWATWDDRARECPTPYSDSNKHLCFWPSRMGLQVESAGGQFDMAVTVFHEAWVPLPGGSSGSSVLVNGNASTGIGFQKMAPGTFAWPLEVKVNGALVPVLEHEGRPAVHLAAGVSHIEGAYHWNAIPQRLAIPREIGILALVIDGQPVEAPVWDAQGFLWLKRDGSTGEADKDFLAVKLYAAVEDGIPLWLRTQVELTVSGKSREEDIGVILPEGWKLARVDSPIPVVVDDAGRMKAQVRAGKWVLHTDAFRFDNPKEFHYAKGGKVAVAEELVAFRARPDFRTVEITGSPSIDVSQTAFPEEWHELPVYRWSTATPFQMEERLRGMGQQKPEGLKIVRDLWLDEDGRGLTFRDQITGRTQQIWRLDAAAGQSLGSVRAGGQGQLITRNPQNEASGVELRTRDLDLEATGRMERAGALSATGWRSDADALSVTLNLPPGWRLFALFGADWVRGDWLTAWTLLDLFVLLIFSLAVFRLWGLGAGLLAFAAFGLSYHEPGAPRYLWLFLLVALALQRVVPKGWGRRILGVGKWVIVAIFALVLVPFVAKQSQQAIYPQLEIVREGSGAIFPGFGAEGDRSMGGQEAIPAAPAPAEETGDAAANRTEKIMRKLQGIIIPKLELRDATIREAIDFLKKKSVDLDVDSPAGEKGVNIVLKVESVSGPAPEAATPPFAPVPGLEPIPAGPGAPAGYVNPADARVTVSLTNIPLIEALRYVTSLAALKFKVEPYAVFVVPASVNTDILITKEWRVRPDLLPNPSTLEAAKDWLVSNGVQFNGPGASAVFVAPSHRLIVRNTQEQLDLIDSIMEANAPAAPAALNPLSLSRVAASNNLAYYAKARIQTGPGVPEWQWRAVTFGWNGPVSASQEVKPVLISLTLERALTILRVALLLILAAVLLSARKLGGPMFRAVRKAGVALVFVGLAANASAQAPIPDQSTLERLRQRLLEHSDAYPNAADIPSASLTLHERKIVIDAEIHTAVRVAVPLPGKLPAWSPLNVLIDDKPEVALRRDDGYLWVLLEAGVHHVRVEGSLANVSEWEWTFLLKPRQVKIEAPGWTFTGVKPDGSPEAQVLFALKQKIAADASSYDHQDLQPIVEVYRNLEFGLVWQVGTSVARLSPLGKAISVHVPLLPGENVLSSNAVVKDGFIEVRLGAQQQAFNWESSLSAVNSLKLATRADDAWVEHWRLVASPIWDVTLAGLPPTFEPGATNLVPVWQPWPGESVELAVSRPEAMAGATVTVSKATLQVSLGKRQRVSELDLLLRCSLGEDFLVELPPDVEITSLSEEARAIPVRKDGNKLIIPVHPGEQTVVVGWKRNVALGLSAGVDAARLPVESANIETVITVPDDRWVLWAGGPRRGPAVRFWGILVCSLLAAAALSRIARSPIGAIPWMLLVIGLTQVPLAAAFVVVGWLFFLAWRGSESFQRLGNVGYNTLQVTLILLTVAALGVLLAAVGEGLLGRPEMFIIGNGSSQTSLRWFQPRSGNLLPHCGCLSISIWWYRLLMLAWALWLAASVIRWLRVGWQSFGSGGFFHGKPKPQPKAEPTPPPLPTL